MTDDFAAGGRSDPALRSPTATVENGRRRAQTTLSRFQAALDTLPDAVLFVDPITLAIVDVNRTACTSLGYTRDQLLAMRLPQIAPKVGRAELLAQGSPLACEEDKNRPLRVVQRLGDGRESPADWFVGLVRETEGGVLVLVSRPVADFRPEKASPSWEAHLDGLTGLPDRRSFDARLAWALGQAQRQADYRFAVFFIDLDGFKRVNDCFGHLRGDRLLCGVARRLSGCVRPGDVVARWGGDEFTVLVDHVRDEQDAIGVAERIQTQLGLPLDLDGAGLTITASIGIALGWRGYTSPNALIRDADRAMYHAKASGKARYVVFDEKTWSGSETTYSELSLEKLIAAESGKTP